MTEQTMSEELEARLAKLRAANEAATGWGAAVRARHEEIKGIESERRRSSSPQTTSQATELADELDVLFEAYLNSNEGGQTQAVNEVALHKALWDNKAGIIAYLKTAPALPVNPQSQAWEGHSDKPIPSMDIWQAYAAAQDEIVALHTENVRLGEENCELRNRPGDVRAEAIANCAQIAKDYTPAKHDGTLLAHVVGITIEKTIRALSQAPATDAAGGWQSIETAPRDGTRVLLYVVHPGDEYAKAGGSPDGWQSIEPGAYWTQDGWEHQTAGDPTHWMPLPAIPGGSHD